MRITRIHTPDLYPRTGLVILARVRLPYQSSNFVKSILFLIRLAAFSSIPPPPSQYIVEIVQNRSSVKFYLVVCFAHEFVQRCTMVGEYEMTDDDTMHIERAYLNKKALANGKCSIEESRKKKSLRC